MPLELSAQEFGQRDNQLKWQKEAVLRNNSVRPAMSLKMLGSFHNAPDTFTLRIKDVPSGPAWKFRLHSWASVNTIVGS